MPTPARRAMSSREASAPCSADTSPGPPRSRAIASTRAGVLTVRPAGPPRSRRRRGMAWPSLLPPGRNRLEPEGSPPLGSEEYLHFNSAGSRLRRGRTRPARPAPFRRHPPARPGRPCPSTSPPSASPIPERLIQCPASTRLTFTVLATGAGVFSMLQSLIAPALPTVQHALHTSQSTATWVMTAYQRPPRSSPRSSAGSATSSERSGPSSPSCWPSSRAVSSPRWHPDIGVLIVARIVMRASAAPCSRSPSASSGTSSPRASERSGISNLSAVIAAGGGVGMVAAGPDRVRARLPLAVLDPGGGRRRDGP